MTIGFVTSINQVDVALVSDFDKLATFLRDVVNQLCTPSLTIRKLAQTPGSIDYTPASDWSINTKPTVAGGGTYRWILPDTDPLQTPNCGNPRTRTPRRLERVSPPRPASPRSNGSRLPPPPSRQRW